MLLCINNGNLLEVDSKLVPENDVLIASTKWLITERRIVPIELSVARGAGINYSAEQQRLIADVGIENLMKEMGFPRLRGRGPDIMGIDVRSLINFVKGKGLDSGESEWWQIECKGAGSGKPSTQRNNFDRGLASVVSCYGSPCEFGDVQAYLGLALPKTQLFMNLLKSHVQKPLRQVLNLWVLIYDAEQKSIDAIEPDREYPF